MRVAGRSSGTCRAQELEPPHRTLAMVSSGRYWNRSNVLRRVPAVAGSGPGPRPPAPTMEPGQPPDRSATARQDCHHLRYRFEFRDRAGREGTEWRRGYL